MIGKVKVKQVFVFPDRCRVSVPYAASSRNTLAALFLLLSCVLPACTQQQQLQSTTELASGTCHVRLKDGRFVIGNAHVERTWRWDNGQLFPESLLALPERVEWMTPGKAVAAPVGPMISGGTVLRMRAAFGTFSAVENPSLRAELEVTGSAGSVRYEFQMFPEAAGVRMWIEQTGSPNAGKPAGAKTAELEPVVRPDTLDRLLLRNSHLRLTQVILRDRTDERNELVFENEWLLQANEAPLNLQGNLFDLEDTLTGNGLVMLKEAPQPEMRPVSTAADATVSLVRAVPGGRTQIPGDTYDVSFHGHGFTGSGKGYPFVLLAYSGGAAGRTAALHQYQRQMHAYHPERDGLLLSNNWGDRSRDTRVNEAFVHAEIDVARRLGVDVVEVDDGWEQGRTINAAQGGGIWNGYWETDPDFWRANPVRLPHGLPGIVDYAHARGLKLGLWFAPDSASDFQSWQKDADQLVAWSQQFKVDAFKLDSVKISSKAGEANYFGMLDQVQRRTGGKVLLDLDVTADTRQGYFGNIAAGPVFLENRYTDSHRYWPHQTLRNLWKLSRWVDPLRLRVEFLNSDRNTALYGDDPLAPARYASSTLFATTLVSSPLAWFELTGLSEKYIADAAPVIARWKQERTAMQNGTVLPIGDVPDGITWTGFASQAGERRGGYLLVFRERNASADWTVPADIFQAEPYRVTVLGGTGSVTAQQTGLRVHIDAPLGFVWVRLDPLKRVSSTGTARQSGTTTGVE